MPDAPSSSPLDDQTKALYKRRFLRGSRWFWIMMYGIGVPIVAAFIFIGFSRVANNVRLLVWGVRTNAQIVDNIAGHTTERDRYGRQHSVASYVPRVSFSNTAGETVIATSSSGFSEPLFNPGDRAEIAYDPQNPQNFIFVSQAALTWEGPLLFSGLGIVFLIAIIFFSSMIIKMKREELEAIDKL